MMKEELQFISDISPEQKGMDFELLRNKGLEYIQKLSGDYWTDYNIHDPGVTILEQLCYGLMDLSYRTGFDIEKILLQNKDLDQSFFKPEQILPCNALTINDYRKLIFDAIFDVKNVWLEVFPKEENTLGGLYRLLVDAGEHSFNEDKIAEIKQQVKEVYCNNRNVCEDIEDVVTLKPVEVQIVAEIEIDGMHDLESILAQIYYQVEQHLSPEIRFYSLQEMLNEGLEYNDIFNGPLLKHGFIKDEELHPKNNKVILSEIIKIIMQIEGVSSVKKLHLEANGEVFTNQMDVDKYSVLRLNLGSEKLDELPISFFKGSIRYSSIDMKTFKRFLNELQSANKKVYRIQESTFQLEETEDKRQTSEKYYTIQTLFPSFYGIGAEGIPNSPGAERKAQAKQLKAFLLLFEQIMANYLSQLAHVKELLSMKTQEDKTYFYQELKEIPNLSELLKSGKKKIHDTLLGELDIPQNYKEGLPILMQLFDDYNDRKNRFLDYLLGIHGESYTQYSLSQFNYYFDNKEFDLFQIQTKTRLLQFLSSVNQNRAKSFNYLQATSGTDNLAGMEARISLLLGLGIGLEKHTGDYLYQENALLQFLESNKIRLFSEEEDQSKLSKWNTAASIIKVDSSKEDLEVSCDYIDDEDIKINEIDEKTEQHILKQTLPFKAGILSTKFLREGINIEKYRAGKLSNSEKYVLGFQYTEDSDWLIIAVYKNINDCNLAAYFLSKFLTKANIQSEGMHLIEHILLRPNKTDQMFGIYLKDKEGNLALKTTERFSFEERKEVLKKIAISLKAYENYSVEANDDRDFEIFFKTLEGNHNLVSVIARDSVEETHSYMEELFKYLSDADITVDFTEKTDYYIQYADDFPDVHENFFSYRLSIVFPNWTARFNNTEFRTIVQDTVEEHKPANIPANIVYYSPGLMLDFEKLYYGWKGKMANNNSTKEDIQKAAIDLARFIINNRNLN